MRDARAQPTARREDAGGLAHGDRHVVDVHEAVVGDDEVEGAVVERQGLGGTHDIAAGGVGLPGGAHERRRRVEAGHAMAARDQVAGDAALAAADLERRGARRRDQREEGVAVDPVGVVAGVRGPTRATPARAPRTPSLGDLKRNDPPVAGRFGEERYCYVGPAM